MKSEKLVTPLIKWNVRECGPGWKPWRFESVYDYIIKLEATQDLSLPF